MDGVWIVQCVVLEGEGLVKWFNTVEDEEPNDERSAKRNGSGQFLIGKWVACLCAILRSGRLT